MKEENILEMFNDFINRSYYENDEKLGLVYYPSKKSINEGLNRSMA